MSETEPACEPAPLPEDVAAMRFEEAMAALEAIVADLERGDLTLDQSLDAYERGAYLRRRCAELLSDAKLRIARVEKTVGGDVELRSL